jgi:hypothetical protein
MNLTEMTQKGKNLLDRVPRDIWVVLILVLSSSASFGLGILAGRDSKEGSGFSISSLPLTASSIGSPGASPAPASLPAGGQVVASKNGTKYFLPWCGGAKQITEANKIWFASKDEAETKGYQPAANCKGL